MISSFRLQRRAYVVGASFALYSRSGDGAGLKLDDNGRIRKDVGLFVFCHLVLA
jgi:hypothetical protein